MTDLNEVASATLFSDQNKQLLAQMLDAALQQPMTPMEPDAAKHYMEQTALRTAESDGSSLKLFQMVQLKSSESTYLMRIALFADDRAMGLDIMDLETGQFFIPEACPVVRLAPELLN